MAEAVVGSPVVAFTAAVTGLFDDSGELAVWALSGEELDCLIEAQLAVLSRMRAQLLVSVAQARVLDRPGAVDAPGMRPWLRGRFGVSPAFAGRLLHEAAALAAAPAAADAARAGTIATEVAVEVGQAVTDLPPELGPELRAEAEGLLLGFATGTPDNAPFDAIGIRYVGRHLVDLLDPKTADRLLGDRLEREEADTHRRRFLSLTPTAPAASGFAACSPPKPARPSRRSCNPWSNRDTTGSIARSPHGRTWTTPQRPAGPAAALSRPTRLLGSARSPKRRTSRMPAKDVTDAGPGWTHDRATPGQVGSGSPTPSSRRCSGCSSRAICAPAAVSVRTCS